MLDTSPERMKRFFSPQAIAVIGASNNNHWFPNLINNLARIDFRGKIYPVNPGADEVCGIKAFRSIGELPEKNVDFAVIMVRSGLVLDTLRQLRARDILNVLLISSGFAETGTEGTTAQKTLREYCVANNMLVMGPNCLGFMNPAAQVNVFVGGAVEGTLRAGTIAVIGQSGAGSEVVVSKLLTRSAGISLYATTGNEAVLAAEDCMAFLVEDEETRVICAFMETIRDTEKLKAVAHRAAAKGIPIILIKVGRSEKGKRAARSHTGALAGNDKVAEGLFRQLGIIRVESVEELVETALLFSRHNLPKGGGLCICTFSGGLSGLYADLCDARGVDLPPLQEKTRRALKECLPSFAVADNPLDVTGAGYQGGFRKIIEILMEDDNIHIILPLCIPPRTDQDRFAEMINEPSISLAGATDTLIIPIIFREITDFGRDYLGRVGLSYIESPETGFSALSHMIRYASFLEAFQHRGSKNASALKRLPPDHCRRQTLPPPNRSDASDAVSRN